MLRNFTSVTSLNSGFLEIVCAPNNKFCLYSQEIKEKNLTSSVACVNNFQCKLNFKQISSLSDFKHLIPSRISTSLRGFHKKKKKKKAVSYPAERTERGKREGGRRKRESGKLLPTSSVNFTLYQQCLVYRRFRENTFINVFLRHDLFFHTCHFMS